MKRRLILKLLGSVPVWAQRSASGDEPVPAPFASVMDATVADAHGNPVTDLGPADFAIAEGDEPRQVVAFAAVDALSGATRAAAPLPLPMEIDPGGVHRTFLLVVDDAGISSYAADALRSALVRFVNEQIGDRDQVALLRSSEGKGWLEAFTADHRLLGEAIEQIVFNPAARAPAVAPWSETLRYALDGLRAVHGRKAVVLFWEGAPRNFDSAPFIALANRSWASLYPAYIGPAAAPPSTMAPLARETGGLELSGSIPTALARVLSAQQSYYLLGFQAAPPPARANTVALKLLRPGLELHARASLPEIAPHLPPVAPSPRAELERLVAGPFASGSLDVGISAAFVHTDKYGLDILLTIDPRGLAVTRNLDGAYEAGFDVLIAVYGKDGVVAPRSAAAHPMHMTPEQYRKILDDGLAFMVPVSLSSPDTFQVRVAVLDSTSSNSGIAHCSVEVPDVSTGRLLLSGIVLEPAGKPGGSVRGSALEARRRFRVGQAIDYQCSIYNASSGNRKGVDLEVQPKLYRRGQVVWAGDPTPLSSQADGHAALNILGQVTLGEETVPGDFVLQLTVTDRLTEGGAPRTASQWTSFSLR